MGDGHAGIITDVESQPVARLTDARNIGCFGGEGKHGSKCGAMFELEVAGPGDVLVRDDEQVDGGARVDIADGECLAVFDDLRDWDIPGGHAAEKAIGHAAILAGGSRLVDGGSDGGSTRNFGEPTILGMADPLSLLWSPVCAVGSHGRSGPNAQICVSVFGASVVADRPRLQVNLWKDNYTHDLVSERGTLAITVLAEAQAPLVERLGLVSGRDGDKLEGAVFALTAAGDPYFPDGVALIDCAVLSSFELGDATGFLVAVRERRWLTGSPVLDRQRMHELLEPEFAAKWEAKLARSLAGYRDAMTWG